MVHLNIFYFILILLSGFSAFIICSIVYYKTRDKKLFYYLIFFSAITLQMLLSVIYLYIEINIPNHNFYFELVIVFCLNISSCFLMYTILLLTNSLVIKEKSLIFRQSIALLTSVSAFILFFFSIQINWQDESIKVLTNVPYYIIFFLFTSVIIYNIINQIVYYKSFSNEEKKVTKKITILLLCFLPFILFDILNPINTAFKFFPFLYCFFSIILIRYVFKKYTSELNMLYKEHNKIHEGFFSNYDISNRERELIIAMQKGFSNKKIADTLFISLNTVKTHIKNILRKVNSKSRFELLAKIRDFSTKEAR